MPAALGHITVLQRAPLAEERTLGDEMAQLAAHRGVRYVVAATSYSGVTYPSNGYAQSPQSAIDLAKL